MLGADASCGDARIALQRAVDELAELMWVDGGSTWSFLPFSVQPAAGKGLGAFAERALAETPSSAPTASASPAASSAAGDAGSAPRRADAAGQAKRTTMLAATAGRSSIAKNHVGCLSRRESWKAQFPNPETQGNATETNDRSPSTFTWPTYQYECHGFTIHHAGQL